MGCRGNARYHSGQRGPRGRRAGAFTGGIAPSWRKGRTESPAALATTLLDLREFGAGYAKAMVALSKALAGELTARGIRVFASDRVMTTSHQFAVEPAPFGGGQAASKTMRWAGFLACGIGLPIAEVAGDLNDLRIGTQELVRRGVTPADAPALAELIAEGLRGNAPEGGGADESVAREVHRPAIRSRLGSRAHSLRRGAVC